MIPEWTEMPLSDRDREYIAWREAIDRMLPWAMYLPIDDKDQEDEG